MTDLGTLDVFGFFINNFKVSDIYLHGWIAAQEWTAVISSTLIALALYFRYLEETAKSLTTGKSNMLGAFWSACGFTILVAVYFGLASVVIDLFNAIHNTLGSSKNMQLLGAELDALYSTVSSGDYEFAWTDITNSAIFLFAVLIYAITYGVLIFVTVALRIGHALLVTFVLFWGAVAFPMSITNGLKMLGPFKTIIVTLFIWPIIEAFFIYLISASFITALERAGLDGTQQDTFNLGTLVYFTAIFSIMNLLLTATTVSAPLVAQAIANGTGNITGMVGSFAAAGIAAGVAAGKLTTMKATKGAVTALDTAREGANSLGANLGEKYHMAKRPSMYESKSPLSSDKAFMDAHVKQASSGLDQPKESKGYDFNKSSKPNSGIDVSNVNMDGGNQSSNSEIKNSVNLGANSPEIKHSSGYSFGDNSASKDKPASSTSATSPSKPKTDGAIKRTVNLGGSNASKADTASAPVQSSLTSDSKTSAQSNLETPNTNQRPKGDDPITKTKSTSDSTTSNGNLSNSSKSSSSFSSDKSDDQQVIEQNKEELETPEGQDEEIRSSESNRKKIDKQAKRGAIINNLKNKGK